MNRIKSAVNRSDSNPEIFQKFCKIQKFSKKTSDKLFKSNYY